MKLIASSLLFIILLGCVTSCSSGSYDPRLIELETALEQAPDSVFPLIEAINPSKLSSDGDRALYGLLLTRGRHKNFIDETNDSLITVSYSFFREKGDKKRLIKSLYMRAYLNLNEKDYHNALISLMEVEDIANRTNDFEYLARIYQLYSDIYLICYNTAKSYEYAVKATEFYRKADMKKEADYASVEEAISLFNIGEFKKSEIMIDSIIKALNNSDSTLLAYAYSSLASAQARQRQYDSAEHTIQAIRDLGIPDNEETKLIQYEIYLSKGQTRKAEEILDSIATISDPSLSIPVLEAKYELSWAKGRFKEALLYSDSITTLQHREMRHAMSQPINNAMSDFFRRKTIQEKNLSERLKLIMGFSTIIVFITIIAGCVYIRYVRTQIKLKNITIDNRVSRINELLNTVRNNETNLAELNESIGEKSRRICLLESKVKNLSRC